MSYVPGFGSDVFVSYSTVDNEIIVDDGDGRRGWVDAMLEKLRRELNSRIGSREVSFLIDHEFMRSNLPITSQVIDAVRSSATLLVVLSPSYLASQWCGRERQTFLKEVQDRVKSGSMLVVRARPVMRDEQPEDFRDLRGIEFFLSEGGRHRMLGNPNANELPFIDRIFTLSEELAQQLQRLRRDSGRIAPPSVGDRVFVAAATDDLEDREAELRSYLTQAGLHVLPSPHSRHSTTDLAAYEASVVAELTSCSLFVQLLGPSRGRALEFAPNRRLPSVQFDLARRVGTPVLQWRARELDVDGVRDADHRVLLEAARACGFEEFKRAAVEQARKRPPPAPRPSPHTEVFVNANAADRELARELGRALAEIGVDCYWPIEKGEPEAMRAYLENSLQTCDGLVLVYGQTRLDWVHQQLKQARKFLAIRPRPVKALAVFEGPPADKPELAAAIPDMMTLNCRNGVDPAELREFVQTLRTNPR